MKKSIVEKALKLNMRAAIDNPVNRDDRYGDKYFLEYRDTHQIVARFKTQRTIEYYLDEIIELNRAKEAQARYISEQAGGKNERRQI